MGICCDEARGSCRSVASFDIIATLDRCSDVLIKRGGHPAAAGFTACANALDALQARLRAIAELEQPEDGWQRVLMLRLR